MQFIKILFLLLILNSFLFSDNTILYSKKQPLPLNDYFGNAYTKITIDKDIFKYNTIGIDFNKDLIDKCKIVKMILICNTEKDFDIILSAHENNFIKSKNFHLKYVSYNQQYNSYHKSTNNYKKIDSFQTNLNSDDQEIELIKSLYEDKIKDLKNKIKNIKEKDQIEIENLKQDLDVAKLKNKEFLSNSQKLKKGVEKLEKYKNEQITNLKSNLKSLKKEISKLNNEINILKKDKSMCENNYKEKIIKKKLYNNFNF